MDISVNSSVSLQGFSSSSANTAQLATASVVRNDGDGQVVETIGRLKVSELDGKNVASMYQSGPGEGEVLSRVRLGNSDSSDAPKKSAADSIPDLYPNRGSVQAEAFPQHDGGDQPAQSVPTSAATFAYQAVSGFGGSAQPASTVSFSS